ncbi:MAG: sulfurtransferase [Thermoplasmatota archaeon]|nr:sulfurtransferase [Halobacteriales archaeon]
MAFGPLVTCEEAARHVDDPSWVFFDCRFELADKEKGARDYAKAHIPGAYFAHTERDLSGPVGNGSRGRHPLPIAFQRFCGVHGIGPATKVVCYDDLGGQWASRLWWLLRFHGHRDVAVLDGGLTRWKALGLPLRGNHEKPRAGTTFANPPGQMPIVQAGDIEAGGVTLFDARAPERFRGEVEAVDKQKGHIPGARSAPASGNVGPDMRFLSPEALRAKFAAPTEGKVACYCGSGVTGTQLVLAMEVAGLPTPALYPGSWSEWIWDGKRPIETGPAVVA